MPHNNSIFLMGKVVSHREREVASEGGSAVMLDLRVQTDRLDAGGVHRVIVQRDLAQALNQRLQSSSTGDPEVMVLGWLYSQPDEVIVMASQVSLLETPDDISPPI